MRLESRSRRASTDGPVAGRIVEGPWNEALSELVGKPVRVARTEREGDGVDRGARAGASLVSTASLEALRAAARVDEPVDGRRFRMTVGVDGVDAHAEDGWIGERVRVGGAVVLVRERVGRCAVTTRDPDTGIRDLDTLGAIAAYRGDVPTREPLAVRRVVRGRRAGAGRSGRLRRARLVATAVVTGAARGIGEAIARRLHADGYAVALTDIDVEGARRVAGEIGADAFEHDVRELDSWERLLAQLDDVHVLVNNAARTEFRSFFEIDLDEWDDVLATNLRGTYLGCRVVGAQMRERGAGRIVNLASDAAFAASGGSGAHYAASKAGVIAVTRRAATELAPHGVTVNAIAPAAIDGPARARGAARPARREAR